MFKRVYTRREIQMLGGVCIRAVREWVWFGRLPAYRNPSVSPSTYYFLAEDVEKILEEKNTNGYVSSHGVRGYLQRMKLHHNNQNKETSSHT